MTLRNGSDADGRGGGGNDVRDRAETNWPSRAPQLLFRGAWPTRWASISARRSPRPRSSRNGRVEIVGLGNHTSAIPSVVLLRDDGTLLVGDAAERRGQQEPARLAKEFKRRLGDATPIILGHTPYSAERLMAAVVRHVVDTVSRAPGRAAVAVVIAHPANWGPYKRELLEGAAALAGVRDGVVRHRAGGRGRALRRRASGSTRAASSRSTTSAAARSTPPCCAATATASAPGRAAGHRAARRHRLRRGGDSARAGDARRRR